MKKKILALLLSGVLTLSMLSTAFAIETHNVLKVTVDGNTATVTGTYEGLKPGNYPVAVNSSTASLGVVNVTVNADGSISGNGTIDGTNIDASDLTVLTSIPLSDGSEDVTLTNKDSEPEPVTEYTVTFDLNHEGATGLPDPQTVKKDETAKKPADPSCPDCTFEGWFTNKEHADGETAFDFSTPITENTTLYAHWTENGGSDVVAVTGVAVTPATVELKVGGTADLTATVTPENATDKTVTWSSDKEAVATVDANGKVTAVAVGTATITVTTKDGNKTATCTVTVTDATTPSEGVTVTFHYNYTGAPANVTRTTDATSKKVTAWPSNPTRSGYTFNGWYTAASGGTQVNSDTLFENATDLYAHWTATTTPVNPGDNNNSGSSSAGTSGTSSPAIKPLPDRNQGTTTPANPSDNPSDTTPTFFNDVPATYWAAGAIEWVNENGFMNGINETTFNPEGNITRQQMWMIMSRMADSSAADMAAARTWAMGRNLTDGTNPAGSMTRQQLVTFLYRFAQRQGFTLSGSSPLTTFPDNANVASYAQTPLSWAVANGIIAGKNDGRLDPTGTATRAQFATILQRFYTNIVNKNA